MIIGNPIMAGASGPAASIFVTGLSETDTVTATNGSKTLAGVWTQKPNHVLPDGYTQLEYIESTGTQYIDTGFSPKKDSGFYLDFEMNSPFSSTDEKAILGCYNRLNNTFSLTTFTSRFSTGDLSIGAGRYEGHIVLGQRMQAELKNLKYITSTGGSENITLDDNLSGALTVYLFASHDTSVSGDIYGLASSKLYSAKIYDADIIIRNFIPCKRNSDSEIGLYDLVTNAFYANSGSGTFLAGPEIPQTIGGFLIKPIRDFGIWTVTATDGDKTATQDVLVDVITEYEIEMDYKLWLYKNGDECEDVTGGWSSSGYTTGSSTLQEPTKNNDSVTLYCNTNNYVSFIGTVNPISFKGYSKLKCCTKNVSINGTYAGGTIHFNAQKTTNASSGQYVSFVRSSDESECEIDISRYQGTYYVCAEVFNATSKADLTKVWLE